MWSVVNGQLAIYPLVGMEYRFNDRGVGPTDDETVLSR
jgi:hypothetical protein